MQAESNQITGRESLSTAAAKNENVTGAALRCAAMPRAFEQKVLASDFSARGEAVG